MCVVCIYVYNYFSWIDTKIYAKAYIYIQAHTMHISMHKRDRIYRKKIYKIFIRQKSVVLFNESLR